jgi:hypothetical protein
MWCEGSTINTRRSFLGFAVGMVAGPLLAQKAILEKGQAITCDSDSILCPVCKVKTCPTINSTLAIGNENRNYPEVNPLFDFHVVRCDMCHVLFTRE